jgi:hypothetical protein
MKKRKHKLFGDIIRRRLKEDRLHRKYQKRIKELPGMVARMQQFLESLNKFSSVHVAPFPEYELLWDSYVQVQVCKIINGKKFASGSILADNFFDNLKIMDHAHQIEDWLAQIDRSFERAINY